MVRYHLAMGSVTVEQRVSLLCDGSRILAEVIDTPVDRTRAFILEYPATYAAVGGRVVAVGAPGAPYFEVLVGAHRPSRLHAELLAGLTRLIADVLDVDRSVIRGYVQATDPDSWGVAGVPLSRARAGEFLSSRKES